MNAAEIAKHMSDEHMEAPMEKTRRQRPREEVRNAKNSRKQDCGKPIAGAYRAPRKKSISAAIEEAAHPSTHVVLKTDHAGAEEIVVTVSSDKPEDHIFGLMMTKVADAPKKAKAIEVNVTPEEVSTKVEEPEVQAPKETPKAEAPSEPKPEPQAIPKATQPKPKEELLFVSAMSAFFKLFG